MDAYPGRVEGFWGDPPRPAWERARSRGNIETLVSGSLRVRVYAGDVLTGRDLYLKQTIPDGPRARRLAQDTLEELLRQVEEGRQPKTNASLQHLVQRHLQGSAVMETLETWEVAA